MCPEGNGEYREIYDFPMNVIDEKAGMFTVFRIFMLGSKGKSC
jgi:hypothetical protein